MNEASAPPRRLLPTLAVVAVVVLPLTGCSTYEASVYGVVTLDGERLDHGTVKFTPKDGGPAAFGMVQSDGSYQLQTGREGGLPAGEYVATVVSLEKRPEEWTGAGPPPPGKPIVPLWYRDPNYSGLDLTVTSGSNEINLELTREMPAALQARGGRR